MRDDYLNLKTFSVITVTLFTKFGDFGTEEIDQSHLINQAVLKKLPIIFLIDETTVFFQQFNQQPRTVLRLHHK